MNEAAIAKLGPLISYLSIQAENARPVGHNYRQGTDQTRAYAMGREGGLQTAISLINEIMGKTKTAKR
ncbi:hypothetical protein [Lacticaseibacillus paracasei]|uniref:hypothetical protein n=1 Tax=Lacticaseibacillus paracasei TaxID=1597 RepID=UPI0022236AA6|nr:hypothetical protein [Lacticaseibacillus paracasei]UYX01540.1 hypothetical protein OH134_04740 [Lacticaseibacillus paracasei subsp. tolerans]UYX01596.1 hypothetical protein OH134_05035 [Lacticaseibacillus paracasei subsp. tolerans]UYX04579.1 hypothetical protein OH135_05055 [Lacticaseibacillus paracasei subsp. tolerans]